MWDCPVQGVGSNSQALPLCPRLGVPVFPVYFRGSARLCCLPPSWGQQGLQTLHRGAEASDPRQRPGAALLPLLLKGPGQSAPPRRLQGPLSSSVPSLPVKHCGHSAPAPPEAPRPLPQPPPAPWEAEAEAVSLSESQACSPARASRLAPRSGSSTPTTLCSRAGSASRPRQHRKALRKLWLAPGPGEDFRRPGAASASLPWACVSLRVPGSTGLRSTPLVRASPTLSVTLSLPTVHLSTRGFRDPYHDTL